MLEKYEFYRRLCGRLGAQKNRLAQVENVLNETSIFNKRKRELLEARLSEMRELVFELEFVKKNIEEELY